MLHRIMLAIQKILRGLQVYPTTRSALSLLPLGRHAIPFAAATCHHSDPAKSILVQAIKETGNFAGRCGVHARDMGGLLSEVRWKVKST
jgi:hypothetical protein